MKHRLKLLAVFFVTAVFCGFYSLVSNSQNSRAKSAAAEQKSGFNRQEFINDVIDRVKKDYVEEKDEKQLAQAAAQGVLSSLDPHSSYLDEDEFREIQVQTKGEFGGVGIEITVESSLIKVITAIDETPAMKAGVKPGDYISKVDGKFVVGESIESVVQRMRGKPGTKVTLTVLRQGEKEPLNFVITRKIIQIRAVKSELFNDIAYIKITNFSEQAASKVIAELRKMIKQIEKNSEGKKGIKGIILDLRNNPGGLLDQSIKISDLFLSKNSVIVSIKGRNAENNSVYRDEEEENLAKNVPMVVLINEGSASASEIVAGALQDNNRAVIMGKKSFGKGSVQSVIHLGENKGALKMTTSLYFTPSGRSIQAHGIEPDIVVGEGKLELVKNNGDTRSEASLDKHLQYQIEGAIREAKKTQLEDDNADFYNTDYQLARALDLLRGVSVYRNIISANH